MTARKRPKKDEEEFKDEDLDNESSEAVDDDDDYDDPEPETEEDEPEASPNEFDIFEDLGQKLLMEGKPPKYTIRKDGERRGTYRHTEIGSWEAVQEKWGGGLYVVSAKDATSGRFLKQQTQLIAAPDKPPKEPDGEPKMMQNPRVEDLSAKELIALYEKKAREEREEARRNSKEQMSMMSEMMKGVFDAMGRAVQQPQDNSMNTILLELIRNQQAANERMNERFEKIMEVIRESKDSGNNGLNLPQVIELMNKAEDKGVKNYREIMDLVDKRSNDRLALMKDSLGSSKHDDDEEDESLVKTAIKTAIPALAGMIRDRGIVQRPPVMAPAPMKPLMRPPMQAAPQPPVQRSVATRPAVSPLVQSRPQDMPANASPQPVKRVPSGAVHVKAEEVKPEESKGAMVKPEESKGAMTIMTPAQEKIISVIEPFIVNWMTNKYRANPAGAAEETVALVARIGISRQQVLMAFPSPQALLDVAHAKGLPKLADKWLNIYYAYFANPPTPLDGASTGNQ